MGEGRKGGKKGVGSVGRVGGGRSALGGQKKGGIVGQGGWALGGLKGGILECGGWVLWVAELVLQPPVKEGSLALTMMGCRGAVASARACV